MLSSMSVDDDDDTLARLTAQALHAVPSPRPRDEILALLPTSLVVHVAVPLRTATVARGRDVRPWLMGAMASAALLCLVLLAALAWRQGHPPVVQIEAAPTALAVHEGVAVDPDVISGASP